MMIGEKIKYLRKKQNLTQEQLAELSNVRQSAISEIENGKRKRVNYEMLRGITTTFGLTIEQFESISLSKKES